MMPETKDISSGVLVGNRSLLLLPGGKLAIRFALRHMASPIAFLAPNDFAIDDDFCGKASILVC
jgi:hypothetical protein